MREPKKKIEGAGLTSGCHVSLKNVFADTPYFLVMVPALVHPSSQTKMASIIQKGNVFFKVATAVSCHKLDPDMTLLNKSNVGPRNTLSRCHLGTLRIKKDWECLGGPVFYQGGLIYLCWSATRLFMVLMALTVMIILNLIVIKPFI